MDGIFLSEQVGYEKPAKEFFDIVLKEINAADRDKVLIIGDSLTGDMMGGTCAGIKTCWYNPGGLENHTEARVDYEIRNLNEIITSII